MVSSPAKLYPCFGANWFCFNNNFALTGSNKRMRGGFPFQCLGFIHDRTTMNSMYHTVSLAANNHIIGTMIGLMRFCNATVGFR